ncbi:nitrate- and nitrite sensing domain-containing protein [Streptomyces globosus]
MPTPRRQPEAAAPPQPAPRARVRRLPRPATVRAKAVSLLVVPAPADGRAADPERQVRRTDAAVRRLRLGDRHTVAEAGGLRTAVAVRLRESVSAAEGLAAVRKDTADRRAAPDAAHETYNRVADAALAVLGSLAGGDRPDLGTEARVLPEFTRAGELLSREDALMASPGPRTAESIRRLAGLVGARRALTAGAAGDLPAVGRDTWQSAAESSAYTELTAAEDRALAAAPEPAKGPVEGAAKGTAKDAARDAAQPQPAGWDAAYASVSGLFVVSRLAARHGVRVHLRPSPYGGTTAVVLLPEPLLQGAGEREPEPAGAAPPSAPRRRTGAVAPPPARRPAVFSASAAAAGGGLPRRTRRAGLAPRLRRPPQPQEPQAAARPAEEAAGPGPERARDRMAAYRAGWVRGAQEKPARPGGEGATR